jgi:hypothetical protein
VLEPKSAAAETQLRVTDRFGGGRGGRAERFHAWGMVLAPPVADDPESDRLGPRLLLDMKSP